MKTFLTLAFLAAALAAPAAHSDDAHHPEGAAGKAPRTAPAPRVDEKSMQQMHDHMAKMQEFMATMQKTTDPAERQRLMDEHMKSMHGGMSMMRGMAGGMMQGMMGGGITGGAAKDGATLDPVAPAMTTSEEAHGHGIH